MPNISEFPAFSNFENPSVFIHSQDRSSQCFAFTVGHDSAYGPTFFRFLPSSTNPSKEIPPAPKRNYTNSPNFLDYLKNPKSSTKMQLEGNPWRNWRAIPKLGRRNARGDGCRATISDAADIILFYSANNASTVRITERNTMPLVSYARLLFNRILLRTRFHNARTALLFLTEPKDKFVGYLCVASFRTKNKTPQQPKTITKRTSFQFASSYLCKQIKPITKKARGGEGWTWKNARLCARD